MDDVESLLADLARWTGDARAGEAAQSRMRERWLRRQAEEDARFAGVLLDLSEGDAAVAVRTTTGRTLHGRLVAVARDFCVVRHAGLATFLAFSAIASVRPEPGHLPPGAAASERAAPVGAGLGEALAGLAGERLRVRITLEGSTDALAGDLRSVGADVVTLGLDSMQGGSVYVPLAAVREVTLLG